MARQGSKKRKRAREKRHAATKERKDDRALLHAADRVLATPRALLLEVGAVRKEVSMDVVEVTLLFSTTQHVRANPRVVRALRDDVVAAQSLSYNFPSKGVSGSAWVRVTSIRNKALLAVWEATTTEVVTELLQKYLKVATEPQSHAAPVLDIEPTSAPKRVRASSIPTEYTEACT